MIKTATKIKFGCSRAEKGPFITEIDLFAITIGKSFSSPIVY